MVTILQWNLSNYYIVVNSSVVENNAPLEQKKTIESIENIKC